MPIERSLRIATLWLLPSVLVALPLLLVDASDSLLSVTTVHLGAVVLALLVLSFRLAALAEDPWFEGVKRVRLRWFATAAAVTAIVTGYSALTTLATSAALRFDPSLQFLQLLSVLDIAWVVAASVIGSRWIWGATASRVVGPVVAVVCVWSIWRYLDAVGFGPNGQWVVDGEQLWRLVLPVDMVAAIAAITLVLVGIRRRQATEQPSPQSYD